MAIAVDCVVRSLSAGGSRFFDLVQVVVFELSFCCFCFLLFVLFVVLN